MPQPTATDTLALLRHFERSFADATLSVAEAQDLRRRLAAHGLRGTALEQLRHQLFALARERFNSFQDKAAIEWLEAASTLLLPTDLPAAASPVAVRSEVFFSPGTACVDAIRNLIGQAAHRLEVCVFTISDDRITAALLAAHRRGVAVRLLTDNDKLLDKGSDIRELQAGGLPVRIDRTANHMHHKFAVADNRRVLTGSYNWTRSAALYNLENLLITDDRAVVRRYTEEFERLWAEMAQFDPA
ncbi:PLD-like domain-containing protein [Hymenobacter daecheongensis DSM 21074]|uniref:phospholipase D n=1 Tax=Hymenobacter daecheongensis DSM 21074 TaxID=1121955 RepID=A0A1M6AJD4_9BACT|nr:phospholipase D-like domain-containing protein [Hymenobacter daecheongensis]SHI36537.1 PLD-like domain-containing protein [Hymenobacter daecheongensis DSM 21074]